MLKENGIYNYEIKYCSHGKPFVMGNNLSFKFNISHSGDWVACFYDNCEVGIDIEKIRKIDYDRIAKRFFDEQEYKFLKGHYSRYDALKSFYTLWTLKESYLKALGYGLSTSLKSFSVIENGCIKEKLHDKHTKKDFYLKSIQISKDYIMSLCQENRRISAEYKFISLEELFNVG